MIPFQLFGSAASWNYQVILISTSHTVTSACPPTKGSLLLREHHILPPHSLLGLCGAPGSRPAEAPHPRLNPWSRLPRAPNTELLLCCPDQTSGLCLWVGISFPGGPSRQRCHDTDLTRSAFQFSEHFLLPRVLDPHRVTEAAPAGVTRPIGYKEVAHQDSHLGFWLHTMGPSPCLGHCQPGCC